MANLRVDKITSTETFETTGSVQFDGDADYLEASNSDDFQLGTGDFTVEAWVLANAYSGSHQIISMSDGTENWQLFRHSGGTLRWNSRGTGDSGTTAYAADVDLEIQTWHHVAATRSGNTLRLFKNGIVVETFGYNSDLTLSAGGPSIGIWDGDKTSEDWNGHISNLRIVKGTALYTSNFKPSMRELEVVPETVLLACQSKTDASLEKTGKTITVSGNAVANELTPGILTPIVKSGGGSAITGSVEFTSTTDALVLSAGTDFAYGTGDFTIEAWIQPQGINGGETKAIFTQSQSGNDYIIFKVDSDKAIKATFGATTVSGGTVEVGSWHHVAVTRASNTVKIFVNGVASAGTTVSTDFSDTTRNPTIGQYTHAYGSIEYYGFISNLRINKGTALYTADFIPPTRELKNVPGTVLLCCQDENSVTTEATGKTITSNGDPAPSNFTPQVGDDRQITFEGVTKINTDAYFYLPTGDTVTRESRSGRGLFGGAMSPSFNDTIDLITIPTMGNSVDFGDIFSGRYTGTCSSSTRAVFGGGEDPSGVTNIMDFVTIATNSDAINFGDLTEDRRQAAGCSSSTRGLFGGGSDPTNLDIIDFITIASTGDATDFGNLTVARRGVMSCSSPVRGVWGGGIAPGPTLDVIDYVTIASTGNALDFGNLTQDRRNIASGACSNQVRGVFGGGRRAPANANSDIIDYITIASTGNALDFGDLSGTKGGVGACSTLIRGVFAGGYTPTMLNNLEYITIASTGDAKDFGDLTIAAHSRAGCSDSHGGLG